MNSTRQPKPAAARPSHRPPRLARCCAAALLAGVSLRALASHTPVASFRTFPQGVWFDMKAGWDAPPLRGRVTSPYLNEDSEMVEFFLQDATGGIRIRGAEYGYFFSRIPGEPTSILGIEVEVGYLVRLVEEHGELIAELYDPEWSLLVTSPTPAHPAPPVITAADLLSGTHDGWLVQLREVQSTDAFTWPLNQNSQIATVADATGTLNLFIDKDTSLPGQSPPPPGIDYDVTGIVVTGSADTPDLRMLMPRSLEDFDVPEMENLPPTVQAPETVVGAPEMAIAFDVVGNDLNPLDELTFSVAGAPAGASFAPAAHRRHQFTWTPGAADVGEWTMTFEVSDGEFSASAQTLLIVRALSGGPDHPWINEFHYDNIGIDVDEGVELAGRAGIDLSPYRLYTYRTGAAGAPGVLYGHSIQFEGVLPDETGNGYGAVWFGVPRDRFQNAGSEVEAYGAGFALVHVDPIEGETLLQFLSYEGSFTASDGPAAGMVAVDVGVAQGPSTPVGHSLNLVGNGSASDARYEQFDWMGPAPATPGRINNGQAFGGVGGRATVELAPPVAAPARPQPMEPFDVQIPFQRSWTATLLSATLRYSTNGWATTHSTPLSLPADPLRGTFTTLQPLDGLPLGGTASFHAEVTFEGNQALSPAISETASLTIRQRIAFQGFEMNADDTWGYDPQPHAGSILRVSSPTAEGEGALRIGGQSAYQPPAVVAFQNQFIAGYSDVRLSLAYAAHAVDADDELQLSLSYDGGTTWNPPIVLASGFSNWSFGFGEVHPGTQRPFTADANPFELQLPQGVEQVAVRVTHRGNPSANNTRDYYFIDSVALTASGGSLVPLPPAFEPAEPLWVAEATRVNQFTVTAYDPNGDPVALRVVGGLPAGASFSTQVSAGRTVGTLPYEPGEADIGRSFGLTFSAADPDGETLLRQTVAVVAPFAGFVWDFDDGTPQGWTQHRYGTSFLPLWDWDVYPDNLGLHLSQGPASGDGFSPHYAGINGYSLTDPKPVDAWWRSPVIDAAHLEAPTLTFATWHQFAGPDLELYATTDVSQAVDEATWVRLPFDLPPQQQVWQRAEVSLQDWAATPFRLAFRYQADGTSGGSKAWAVDTIRIVEPLAAPTSLAASMLGLDGFVVSWPPVGAATQYRFELARDPHFSDLVASYVGLLTAFPAVLVNGLAPDTPYWARVTALDGPRESDLSTAVELRTLAAHPLLSEYGAGAANNNMYLELFNPHDIPVSLDRIAIRKRTSTLTGFGTPLKLSGALAPGSTAVVVHAAAEEPLRALADLVSDADALAFNGRHAVALFNGETLIDVIGWPGAAWGVDKTFVRRTDIQTPNPVYTPEEWIELAADDWSNVGWFGDPAQPSDPLRPPVIAALEVHAGEASVAFTVTPERQPGVVYRLQRHHSEPPHGWEELPSGLAPETASRASLTDPDPPATGALYRIRSYRP